MKLYHVTSLDRVAKILAAGITAPQRTKSKSRWFNRFNARLGHRDRIYAFDNHDEAIMWGAKMEFDLQCGPTVVITFIDPAAEAFWKREELFPHGNGVSYWTMSDIPPGCIEKIEVVLRYKVKQIIDARRGKPSGYIAKMENKEA
jgi:hypothetical protein